MSDPTALIERRMKRANPVPDPQSLPATTWEPAVAFAEVEARLEHDRQVPSPQPRTLSTRVVAVAAGVAAVIAIGVTVYLLAPSDDVAPPVDTTPTTTEAPVSTSTPETTTTAPQVTTTTAPSVDEAFPGLPKLAFGPLEPGRVAVEGAVPVPFSIDVPDISGVFPLGWWVKAPGTPGVGMVPRDAIDPNGIIDFADPDLIFPMTRSDDLFEVVAADIAGELGSDTVTDVQVGGVSAIRIDVGVIETGFGLSSLGTQSDGNPLFGIIDGTRHRLYVIDAPQGTLIAWIEIQERGWNDLEPIYEAIIQSIEFTAADP